MLQSYWTQTFDLPLFVATLAAPSIDLETASDSGFSPDDNLTNDTTPTFDVDLPSGFGDGRDTVAGDVIRLEISDDATFTTSITDTADAGDVVTDIVSLTPPALADGVYYARARMERGALLGPWSATLAFIIDTTAPTISTSSSQSVAENSAFSVDLAADESVTWTKTGGADQALFTLTGATLGLTAKDFEAPIDADTNNTYIVQVTATDGAGNATNKTITVTVTDVADGGGTPGVILWGSPDRIMWGVDRMTWGTVSEPDGRILWGADRIMWGTDRILWS